MRATGAADSRRVGGWVSGTFEHDRRVIHPPAALRAPSLTAAMQACQDCGRAEGVVQCNCSPSHKLCRACSRSTLVRADAFYGRYRNWCDACIWFDIT